MDLDHARTLDNANDGEVEAFTRKHFGTARDAPPILWHYTDAGGFEGMLSNRTMRATHARFMNDPGEGTHTIEILRDALTEHSADEAHAQELHRLMSIAGVVHAAGTYFACFSEKCDLLSQWRAYAHDGAGYAIGLDAVRVPDCSRLQPPLAHDPRAGTSGPLLLRVIYDDERKRAALDDVVTTILRGASGHDGEPTADDLERSTQHAMLALRMLTVCAFAFKIAAYAEEAEWRLVWIGPFGPTPPTGTEHPAFMIDTFLTRPNKAVPLRFRTTRYGLAPFLEWPLAATEHAPTPVREVWLGPKHTDDTARSVEMFLAWKGYPDVPVHRSKASYR